MAAPKAFGITYLDRQYYPADEWRIRVGRLRLLSLGRSAKTGIATEAALPYPEASFVQRSLVWANEVDERIDLYKAEEEARREECARLIFECFNNVKRRLGELDAWVMFVQFAKATAPELSSARRNSDFDDQVLAAYDFAVEGAKQSAAIEAGARFRKSSELSLRHLARLLARRATASLSVEQLKLAFGLDPLLKVKEAQDQFARLAQNHQFDAPSPRLFDFGELASDGAIEIPPLMLQSSLRLATTSGESSDAEPLPRSIHEKAA